MNTTQPNFNLIRVQGYFDKIIIRENKYCFVSGSPNGLNENDEIEISIINKDFEYRQTHTLSKLEIPLPENTFAINENLYCEGGDDKQRILQKFDGQLLLGRWSIRNNYELSIMRCSMLISKVFRDTSFEDDDAQGYRDILYSIIESRNFDAGKIPVQCDVAYLLFHKLIRAEEAKEFNIFNIVALNKRVSGYRSSYVNYDNRIVQFDDHFIITPDKYEFQYYTFLMLQLITIALSEIRDILNYQLQKHTDTKEFKTKIKDFYFDLPEKLKNPERKEVIWDWAGEPDKVKKVTEKPTPKPENNFSIKEIAIAYRLMGIKINEMNAPKLLQEHSGNKSATKLINTIILPSQLIILSGNKTTDSKHLASLLAAEQLLLGKKDMKALTSIRLIISAFEGHFSNKYLE